MVAHRRFCLAAGQRLTEKGVLSGTNDVFLLYKNELREALAGKGEWQALVEERRATRELSRRIGELERGLAKEQGECPGGS